MSTLGSQVRTNSGSLAYQIGTRNASTLLRLRDGETQILAGLISSQDRSASARVPGVGDLPVLGRLFSNQRDDGQRTELVLAITPRIVRNLRRPDANETELWVGTELMPRLRAIEGRLTALSAAAEQNAAAAERPARAERGSAGSAVPPVATPGSGLGGSADTPALSWKVPSEVKVGETFVATLSLNTPTALRGAPVQIAFSKDQLTVVDVEEGDLFKQGGATTSFSRAIDAAAGRMQVGVLRNQATGASGQGTLLTLRLKAIAPGMAELTVLGAQSLGLDAAAPSLSLPPPVKIQVK